jgi:UDP-N-acetylmuramate dehydrogenase
MTAALREAAIPFREGEPLSRHTTMGVGGPAAVMAFPRSSEELRQSLRLRAELGVPHRVLGGGSNLVVVDEGLDELIVNTKSMRTLEIGDDGRVSAQAGANLIRTAVACSRAGWRGLERAVGIPGSLGGAAVMNAGAYGFSISDVMREIVVFDDSGAPIVPPEGWRFHYRGSSIPDGAAVAALVFELKRDDPELLQEETRQLAGQRLGSQPGGRNAGCVFKNPQQTAPSEGPGRLPGDKPPSEGPGRLPGDKSPSEGPGRLPGDKSAGRLIDELGLKGERRGAAVVSPKHANFVVNEGGASASDVLGLLELVHERVLAATGVDLQLEVKVWRPRP